MTTITTTENNISEEELQRIYAQYDREWFKENCTTF